MRRGLLHRDPSPNPSGALRTSRFDRWFDTSASNTDKSQEADAPPVAERWQDAQLSLCFCFTAVSSTKPDKCPFLLF